MVYPILSIDVGSGTQDALLALEGEPLENCPKFVLPAPARLVAGRISHWTAQRSPLWLHGRNMGGGFAGAVREHMKAGLPVAAHPAAALSLNDDLDRVRAMGVEVAEHRPPGYAQVHLCDYDPEFWSSLLAMTGLPQPALVLAAAQDHGSHPGQSNRLGRFKLWRRFLEQAHGRPEALLFTDPPEELTRLRSLQESTGGGAVADSAAAALLGSLCDPHVKELNQKRGVTILNLGNSHVVGFLLFQGVIFGVYEQHTGMVSAESLLADLAAFGQGRLTNEQVLNAGGHGCMRREPGPDDPPLAKAGDFAELAVLGPRRGLLESHKPYFPAPAGDMMLTGCVGLLNTCLLNN